MSRIAHELGITQSPRQQIRWLMIVLVATASAASALVLGGGAMWHTPSGTHLVTVSVTHTTPVTHQVALDCGGVGLPCVPTRVPAP